MKKFINQEPKSKSCIYYLNLRSKKLTRFENDEIIIERIPELWVGGYKYEDFIQSLKNFNTSIIFKNSFLKTISYKKHIQNWVDIEKEYYILLLNSFQKSLHSYPINKLNKDFYHIKKELINYLINQEKIFSKNFNNPQLENLISYNLYQNFSLKDFSQNSIDTIAIEEFNKLKQDIEGLDNDIVTMDELSEKNRNLISRLGRNLTVNSLKKLLISGSAPNFFNLQPENYLFLNFNYTYTENMYLTPPISINQSKIQNEANHIHGTLNEFDNNPVIFGFGDEIDEQYKLIENQDNNDYLENIKSINYLETNKYKSLLEFINSDNYQIFIFGHSCGISDRTLLNTLFEHKNCVSIKPYYYKIDENNDNYSDIVRNISRNFNDKTMMRDKVVNKTYCEPLS